MKRKDSPWLLALLGLIAVAGLVIGCAGWTSILEVPAR